MVATASGLGAPHGKGVVGKPAPSSALSSSQTPAEACLAAPMRHRGQPRPNKWQLGSQGGSAPRSTACRCRDPGARPVRPESRRVALGGRRPAPGTRTSPRRGSERPGSSAAGAPDSLPLALALARPELRGGSRAAGRSDGRWRHLPRKPRGWPELRLLPGSAKARVRAIPPNNALKHLPQCLC